MTEEKQKIMESIVKIKAEIFDIIVQQEALQNKKMQKIQELQQLEVSLSNPTPK